jgi:hypothetical protein
MYVCELGAELTKIYPSVNVISYPDETYVLVKAERWEDVGSKAETIQGQHISFLKDLGMTVNEAKTEVILVGSNNFPKSL